jgi:hypothetical protein
MPGEPNGYRLPKSGAEDHFGDGLKMPSRIRPGSFRGRFLDLTMGPVRVNQPLTGRELRQFNAPHPLFLTKLKQRPHRLKIRVAFVRALSFSRWRGGS